MFWIVRETIYLWLEQKIILEMSLDACDAISADGWLAWALCCQNSQFHRLMMGGGGLSVQYWPGNWVIRFSHPSPIAWFRPAPMVQPVTRARSPPSEASGMGTTHPSQWSCQFQQTLNTRLETISLTGHDCALPDLSEYWRKWIKLLMFNFSCGSWLMPASENQDQDIQPVHQQPQDVEDCRGPLSCISLSWKSRRPQ